MGRDPAEEFEQFRQPLFGLAYRLMGEAGEAEDVVQEAYLRWRDAEGVAVPRAWLSRVVTNLCLNRLDSARARRERYVGPWLPEPVLTDSGGLLGPLEAAEQRESVTMGLLVLLERLTPAERAVFVLREAFGYSHQAIADIMDISVANSRQLHRRARGRVSDARRRFEVDPARQHAIVERFLLAVRDGDLEGLHRVLAEDVVTWTDGGGRATAARRVLVGREKLVRAVLGLRAKAPDVRLVTAEATHEPADVWPATTEANGEAAGVWLATTEANGGAADVRLAAVEANGEAAVVAFRGGELWAVATLEIAHGRIVAVRSVHNPDKLAFAARQLSRPGWAVRSSGA
ncbi:RNA polymerase sigma factor SigJ [Nonomuraea sp. NPDC000554]|uniref:RNA polymerase sigma factor SigJ n=1 Tax=Nonomuraea sp. NPDC000554 TaxID=3154259 RepID=UPI003318A023